MIRWQIFSHIFVGLVLVLTGCSKGGGSIASEQLQDSLLLRDVSSRTVAVMAVGELPAGSLGIDAEKILEIFSKVSGVSGLRQLLGLMAVINPNGTLGAEYRNAALTFGVVDGARVLTLSFLARSDLSTDTLATLNSTARSHGLDVESVTEREARISSAADRNDSITIAIAGERISFRHSRNGAWPEPKSSLGNFAGEFSQVRGVGALMAIDLGELGHIFGAATPLPWAPPSGSTFLAATAITPDGKQSIDARLHIPGIGISLTKCRERKSSDLLLSSESEALDDAYEGIFSPIVSCLLGGDSGHIHIRWKVMAPSKFEMLVPFAERVVSKNIPDTWPELRSPKVEYLKGCEGVVVYTGEVPTCVRAPASDEVFRMKLPFGFVKRILSAPPPAAEEFLRMMLLYHDAPVNVRATIKGDDIAIIID